MIIWMSYQICVFIGISKDGGWIDKVIECDLGKIIEYQYIEKRFVLKFNLVMILLNFRC